MKRFLAGISMALLSIAAFGTTYTPVQLLNPAGSSAGQAIVSTGPSTVPGFANVAVANVTGAAPSASPTFTGTVTVPTPATSSNTTTAASTAFVQNNFTNPTFAIGGGIPNAGTFTSLSSTSGSLNGTLGGTTANAANFTTIGASGLISPSSTVGIKGTVAADSAQAGSDGEYMTVTGTSAGITAGTTQSTATLTLTPGDWDVQAVVIVSPAGSTIMGNTFIGVSTSSTSLGSIGAYVQFQPSSTAGAGFVWGTPVVRFNVSASTPVYATVNAGFATSTCAAQGFIRARRVR